MAGPEENELKGGIQATLININKNEGTKQFKETAVEGEFLTPLIVLRNFSKANRLKILNFCERNLQYIGLFIVGLWLSRVILLYTRDAESIKIKCAILILCQML